MHVVGAVLCLLDKLELTRLCWKMACIDSWIQGSLHAADLAESVQTLCMLFARQEPEISLPLAFQIDRQYAKHASHGIRSDWVYTDITQSLSDSQG